jgi:hypothetical protein
MLPLSQSTASEVVSYMTPPSALMAHRPITFQPQLGSSLPRNAGLAALISDEGCLLQLASLGAAPRGYLLTVTLAARADHRVVQPASTFSSVPVT